MKNAPTSGTTRNATWEAPWRWVTRGHVRHRGRRGAEPEPDEACADHRSVVVAAERPEDHEQREQDRERELQAEQREERAGEIARAPRSCMLMSDIARNTPSDTSAMRASAGTRLGQGMRGATRGSKLGEHDAGEQAGHEERQL